VVVECVPIDELVSDPRLAPEKQGTNLHPIAPTSGALGAPNLGHPTFIKMDIEGAEMDALRGARETIQKHKPILSICVYHRQDDLWRVPLLIESMAEGYRFYLRPHDVDGWQLVCYAVPEGRSRALQK
jgi:hypothetical protein